MINIFAFINDILYKKKGDLLDNCDNESQFVPYMVNRWLSMYSSSVSKLLNQTVNCRWRVFNDKSMWYKTLNVIIPKVKFHKINYIKKVKEAKNITSERAQLIKFLAINMECSEREIKELISDHNIDLAKYIKAIK